jgi:hypothetical protein
MKFKKIIAAILTAATLTSCIASSVSAFADEEIDTSVEYVEVQNNSSSSTQGAAHDTSRNVQTQGVGNPFNFGERILNSTSVSAIRAKNKTMTVQQIKYSIYKEVDDHWDLLKVRLGISDREKVYALFIGMATRETTLGINGEGADFETQAGVFGQVAGHAYGPLQTAETAYKNSNSAFMTEYDVPEMTQYSLTQTNFYDALISNHMGIRKVLHFVNQAYSTYNLRGYAVIRNAIKGFNTGWATPSTNTSDYTNYADEISALAHWYYSEGHLYDNVSTWTTDSRASKYRTNPWSWLSSSSPSMATVSTSSSSTTTTTKVTPTITIVGTQSFGDVNGDGKINSIDAVCILVDYANELSGKKTVLATKYADINSDSKINSIDAVIILKYYAYALVNSNTTLTDYIKNKNN